MKSSQDDVLCVCVSGECLMMKPWRAVQVAKVQGYAEISLWL